MTKVNYMTRDEKDFNERFDLKWARARRIRKIKQVRMVKEIFIIKKKFSS